MKITTLLLITYRSIIKKLATGKTLTPEERELVNEIKGVDNAT